MNIVKEISQLSEEELYLLSLERDGNNCSTKRALIAQRIIWEKAGYPFHSGDHYRRDCEIIKKF